MNERERERTETHEAIMEATYQALCAHGYADLTIKRISDEFEKSKSLLYYHYETKDALLVDFLDYILDKFMEKLTVEPSGDAHEQLMELLDLLFPVSIEEDGGFETALLELRAQAAHKPEYREYFTRSNQAIRRRIIEIIENGIEQGVFDPVDPEQTARLVLATRNGALLQRSSSNDAEAVESIRTSLDAYLETCLIAESCNGQIDEQ
jgi:AcrR family transcriptional regulator